MLELPVRPLWAPIDNLGPSAWQLKIRSGGVRGLMLWSIRAFFLKKKKFWIDSLVHTSVLGCILQMYAGFQRRNNWATWVLIWSLFPLAEKKSVSVYSHQGLMSPWQWREVTFHPVSFCTVALLSRESEEWGQGSEHPAMACHSGWEGKPENRVLC